jgi:hypothetical protein
VIVLEPGWLPATGARNVLGRTGSYTRRRRRRRSRTIRQAAPASVVNTEIVLFDHGPAEFPVATAVPREARARAIAVAADLKRWLRARWEWFRPRSVPCAVACLGMLATLKSAEYLAHQHHAASLGPTQAHVVHVQIAPR